MTKAELRLRAVAQLRAWALGEGVRAQASAAICRGIRAQPPWINAGLICGFLPMASEPDIAPLWSESSETRLCLPRVRGETVELIRIENPAALGSATWKLAEAAFEDAPVVVPEAVDLFLVPGIAFTASGQRLGRGGGYYDRLLLRRAPGSSRALGVCFAAQLWGEIPIETHDQPVDAVLTETGIADAEFNH